MDLNKTPDVIAAATVLYSSSTPRSFPIPAFVHPNNTAERIKEGVHYTPPFLEFLSKIKLICNRNFIVYTVQLHLESKTKFFNLIIP